MQIIANTPLVKGKKAAVTVELWLLFLWFFSAWAVNFWGDFPLNDDWAYARNVYHLSERGEIYFDPWPAQTLIAQTIWGAFFTQLFGFSFSVLRFSTLVASAIGLIYWYKTWLMAGAKSSTSIFITLLLMFNPFYFTLSYSFMTEIPFLAATMGAFYHWVKFFKKDKKVDYLIGLIYTLIALLVRQHGVLLPIGFAVAWLFTFAARAKHLYPAQNRLNLLGNYGIAILPLVANLATLLIYNHWREVNFGLSAAYGQAESLTVALKDGSWVNLLFIRLGTIGFYLGLFFAPVLYHVFARCWRQFSWRLRFFFLAYFILGLVYYLNTWHRHTIGNVFYNWGLNPELLKDTVEKNNSVLVSHNIWKLIKWVAVFNSLLLYWLVGLVGVKKIIFILNILKRIFLPKPQILAEVIAHRRAHIADLVNNQAKFSGEKNTSAQTAGIDSTNVLSRKTTIIDAVFFRLDVPFQYRYDKLDMYFIQILGLVGCILYMGILILGQYYFDRYHLPLFLFVAYGLTPYILDLRLRKLRLGAKILAVYALFAGLATSDFINFNRARKEATDYLTKEEKINAKLIDGGFEFNGWENSYHLRPQGYDHSSYTSWWFVDKDEYIIGCKPMRNYQLWAKNESKTNQSKYPFFRTLSLSYDTIYIYQKVNFLKYDSSYFQPNLAACQPIFAGQNKPNIFEFDYKQLVQGQQILSNQEMRAGDELSASCWACPVDISQTKGADWMRAKAGFVLMDKNMRIKQFSAAITDSMGSCLKHEFKFIQPDTAYNESLALIFIPFAAKFGTNEYEPLIWTNAEVIYAQKGQRINTGK